MKKFEITFEGKNYDYVTRNMIDEYMRSIFTKAEVRVKTLRCTEKKDKPKNK